jgi:undecaprenyl-diphosphatase
VTVAVPALWGLFHALLHSPRPVDGFVFVDSNGFPSGHTANATAAALVAVLLVWPGAARRARIALVAAAAGFAALIGLTRLALLAHWPTDVLGGWLLALAVVPLLARATAPRR